MKSYQLGAFNLFLAAAFAGGGYSAAGQQPPPVASPFTIQFCDDKAGVFDEQIISVFSDHFWILEQNYLPVDSFGIQWSTESRVDPLPKTVGLLWGDSLIVASQALEPWKRDSFFLKSKDKYFWVKGVLKKMSAWRLLSHGSAPPEFELQQVDLDTLSDNRFAYRGLPKTIEIPKAKKEEILKQPVGYLIVLRSTNSGFEFCFETHRPIFSNGRSQDFPLRASSKIITGLYVIPISTESQNGNELRFKRAGYLTKGSSKGWMKIIQGG